MNAVVFDEAYKWSHWFYPWLIGGVARLFVGFLLLRYARPLWEGWFAWLVFVIIWSAGGWRVSEHLAIQHALASGSYSVVDGTVENFHPMPHHGHTHERFEVRGIRFVYSDFIETQCFNNTTSHGGPIRAGLRVRLTYIAERLLEHCIIRLEILPSASTRFLTGPVPPWNDGPSAAGIRSDHVSSLPYRERGDPMKAAETIYNAVSTSHPPRRLVLGDDAVEVVRSKLDYMKNELADWAAVSTGTSFP